MDEAGFLTRADALLADLMAKLDDTVGDLMDVDLEGGVLTIELDSGGQYVINKHAPMKQIWVSSPASGAAHFDFDPDRALWMNGRTGGELIALLDEEITAAAGRPSGL